MGFVLGLGFGFGFGLLDLCVVVWFRFVVVGLHGFGCAFGVWVSGFKCWVFLMCGFCDAVVCWVVVLWVCGLSFGFLVVTFGYGGLLYCVVVVCVRLSCCVAFVLRVCGCVVVCCVCCCVVLCLFVLCVVWFGMCELLCRVCVCVC